MKKQFLKLSIALAFLFFSADTFASHFRYGTISYEILSETGSGAAKQTVVRFTINQAWRRTAWSPLATIGSTRITGTFVYGDGSSTPLDITTTAVNAADDWFQGTFVTTHTYIGNINRVAYFGSCCRIGGLVGAGANDDFRCEATVTLSQATNENPVTSLPPIVNVPDGIAAFTFGLNATDPNGDAITYSKATSAQQGYVGTAPIYTSVNASTGLVTVNTSGAGVMLNQLYTLSFLVTDSKGATSPIDFILRIVGSSNAPQFISPTPANASTIKVTPNTPINFTIKADDADVADVVTLAASGLPAGASFTPGAAANPVMTPFSWTPTLADLGTSSITFSATDNVGVQTLTTVNIIVSLAPVFDVPPTPAENVHNVILPGNLITFTVKATDPDPLDQLQITNAQGKDPITALPIPLYPGAQMLPPLPSPLGNTSQSVFSWTPLPSQWGHNHVFFTATDQFNDQTIHEVPILVNTPPLFLSQPPLLPCVGQQYVYHVIVNDPDTAYGDVIDLFGINLPPWLTFTDSGNGRGSLIGTPGAGDVGLVQVSIEAQDIHHHMNGTTLQQLSLNVTACGGQPCAFQIQIAPVFNPNSLYALAGANDPNTYYWGLSRSKKFEASVTGGAAPYQYAWSSSNGTLVRSSTKKKAGLFYPTSSCWMVVEITDANGAVCKDSVWVPWSDIYTAPCVVPGQIWNYQVCNTVTGVTSCVNTTAAMRALLQTGDYVLGACSPKTSISINNTQFKAYPNPTAGIISVDYKAKQAAKGLLEVLDMNGRVLFQKEVQLHEGITSHGLDLGSFNNGLYLVKLNIGNQVLVERIQLMR